MTVNGAPWAEHGRDNGTIGTEGLNGTVTATALCHLRGLLDGGAVRQRRSSAARLAIRWTAVA